MLSGPHQKFCEGVLAGLTGVAAYRAAYLRSSASTARASASALRSRPVIKAEIQRMREAAQKAAGSAVLTLAEVHRFIARLVRANVATIDPTVDGDLIHSIKTMEHGREIRLHDKLAAIGRWCDLQGEGSASALDDELGNLLRELRQ